MRATLDWSHELLDADERSLFARLGIFAGGATLDGVESVAANGPVTSSRPLRACSPRGWSSPATTPFRMLEPVRDYAREPLEARDDAAVTRRRHLAYFSRLGRDAQGSGSGPPVSTGIGSTMNSGWAPLPGSAALADA